MKSYAPFDASDPKEALGDEARRQTATLAHELMEKVGRLPPAERMDAGFYLVVGILTAASGVAVAGFPDDDDTHATIRAWMIASLPQAFDLARGIYGLPPLPEAH